uniref:Fibronectin type-III domain-containing protein n=1 Tax=Eptatretus burgeri TaxID=7764 RepID=A0A8C4PZK2_EPTBU
MLPSSARDLIITGLSPLIIYAITVSAQTVIGQGPPSSATISSGVPPELPGAPTNLAISNIGPHSVILQFRAGYGGKTSVSRWLVEAEVKHEEETEGWQQVFELAGGPDARSIEVPGLAPFTHYRFRMRQTNIVGTSPASHPSRHVQTLQAPPYMAPANLSVHASGKNSLLLRWAPLPESSYNALPDTVGYRLQYRHLRAVNRRPDVAEMTWVSIALAGKVSQSNELGGLQKSGSTEVRRETRKPVGKKKSTKIEVQWVVVTDRLERELKLEGLQPWSLYELRIQAFNSISAGPWGQPVRGRTREDVPSAGPENISVVATGPHTLLVTWGAIPEGSKNGWILGYKVLTSNPAEPVPLLDSVATAAQESIVNVSGLQAATLYKLTVLAYTQVGDGVPTDPAVTCHTMEDLPGRPGAVWFPEVSSHAVRLAWKPPPQPNGQILGYRASLLANGSGSNPERTWELGSDVKQVRAAGLAPETRYTFLLAAQTSRGWGSPAEVVIITTQHRGRPAPPGRPWADAKTLGPRTLLLKWAAGAGGFAPVRYYILHRQKMSAGVWQPLASTLPPQPTEFLVNWLEPFTDYLFRLTAINDVGESEPSETSQTVTTLQDVPSKAPALLAVRPVSPTSLLLQWQPPPAGSMNGLLLGYSLRYQQLPSPQEPNPIPGPIIQLTSDPQPPPLAPTMLKTVNDSSLTEYKLQGLERYRHYEVRLSVYNSAGEGPPSDPWEVYVGEALPTAPPRGLHLLSATATQLHLSWQPPQKNNGENDILAYKVYCRKAGSAASSEEKTVRLLKNNVRLGSLLSFTSYLVSVVTVNSAGEGPRSQALQARTLQAAPSAPAYLHFTKMTSSSVNVTWGMPIQPNGLITGFRVIYQPTSPVNGISKIVTVDVPGSSRKWLLIKDLTEGEIYMVGVCARTLAYGPEISGNIAPPP